jgi:hypothetical protein
LVVRGQEWPAICCACSSLPLYVASRNRPVTAGTRERYRYDLQKRRGFADAARGGTGAGSPVDLQPRAAADDVGEGRIGHGAGGQKALTVVTISTRLSTDKSFSHKYMYRHLELTSRDLLGRVERYESTLEGRKTD